MGLGYIYEKVQALGIFLRKNKIFFHDSLFMGNTLCRKNKDLSYTLVIVDGIGDTVLIPVLNWVSPLAKARVEKKWKKHMLNQVKKKLPDVDLDRIKI